MAAVFRTARRSLLQLLIWGGYAAMMIALGRRAGAADSGLLFIAVGVGGGLWVCSELLRALVLRRDWLERGGAGLAWRLLLAVLLLPVVLQVLLYFAIHGALRLELIDLGPGGPNYRAGAVLIYWLNSAMPLGLWATVWVSVQAVRRYRHGELARLRAEARRHALELDALRARLNPHFVFNALNNLRALINEDTERAREMVTRLSNTLRHALEHGNEQQVSLQRELAVVDDYLAIEQVHYEQRLQVERQIDADALDATLPPMMLQLLVENAIKHGIARTPAGGRLRLRARLIDRVLQISVENPGRLEDGRRGHGVGLDYLRARLGRDLPRARFALGEHADGVRATLEIPQ